MALAEYFEKNAQAASLILQGFDVSTFRSFLEGAKIGVAYDQDATEKKEGKACLDLVIRLLGRFYANVVFLPLDSAAKEKTTEFESLMREINPNIAVLRKPDGILRWIIVGKTRLERKGKGITKIYIGSDNWNAKISPVSPVGCGDTSNPFGAGVAACLGAANLFRSVFAEQLPQSELDVETSFSTLQLDGNPTKNPSLKDVSLQDLHLVGAGAIGNGFVWALSRMKVKGDLTIVDGEVVEKTNLQRYALATLSSIGRSKAELAKDYLSSTKLSVKASNQTWEAFVGDSEDWRFEQVAVAVDSADARIHIQSSLPRTIFNSWTQSSEIGLSRHSFLGNEACLACLYLPKGKLPNFDQIVLKALRLPEEGPNLLEVRTRLDTGQPTERAFLDRIASAAQISVDKLLPFEGKPLRKLYVEAICGGAVLEFTTSGKNQMADVPMAFQSAMAGILLAADVVADATSIRGRLPTITQIDLLRKLPTIASSPRKKDPAVRCICADLDFLRQYRAKYLKVSKISRRRAGAR